MRVLYRRRASLRGGGEIERGAVTFTLSAGLAGTWAGTWANQAPDQSTGSFTLTWTQKGSTLSGSITIAGTPCLSGGSITGSVNGSTISFGAVNGEVTVTYDGAIAGATMSGTYATSCGNARGTWTAAKR